MQILYWIAAVLVVFWLVGMLFQIGGALIYWALVAAAVLFVVGLLGGGRAGRRGGS
ncbi:MAG: DUF5670 family protein [Meiothermus sp.]|nr:DUF5670 family protein [Meiothermus sp.]